MGSIPNCRKRVEIGTLPVCGVGGTVRIVGLRLPCTTSSKKGDIPCQIIHGKRNWIGNVRASRSTKLLIGTGRAAPNRRDAPRAAAVRRVIDQAAVAVIAGRAVEAAAAVAEVTALAAETEARKATDEVHRHCASC